mgnify:CR=1 FL=1
MNLDPMSNNINGLKHFGGSNQGGNPQRSFKKNKNKKNPSSENYYMTPGSNFKSSEQHPFGLRELFPSYARWGDPHSTGRHITLAHIEKWLIQAGIVDNWNVTTTDTALSFRKISR